VAGFTGIGGSFRMEWVAALPWNQWQAWTGIRSMFELHEAVMQRQRRAGNLPWGARVGTATPPIPPPEPLN
jgi:hypothetical protein